MGDFKNKLIKPSILSQVLSTGARILGLDYGNKRIGVAISDPGKTVAFPRMVLSNRGNEAVLAELKKLIEADHIERIILGWPLSLQSEVTDQTRKTERFLNVLKEALTIPIDILDERFTTFQAERTGGDDSVAAQIILQTWLDKSRSAAK